MWERSNNYADFRDDKILLALRFNRRNKLALRGHYDELKLTSTHLRNDISKEASRQEIVFAK